jgi:hypothetical protein
MILRQAIRVCSEELQKAKHALVSAYDLIREADERATHLLFIFLGLR